MAALAIVAMAACGGSATAPTGGGIQIVTPAPGATAAPATTPVGAATPVATIGSTVEACSLLSPADLNATLGGDYGGGIVDLAGQCVWTSGNEIVVLFVQDVGLDFIKSSFTGGVDTTVSGHAAYWNPAEGLWSLWVDLGGSRTLVLSFPNSGQLGPDDQGKAEKLAEIAISKL
jgi:hypothetical protein